MKSNKSHYRPDIDGLRALAILLVIVYHAKFDFISGGFIGVDVFFVISGFLITSIILREVEKGTFTYTNFYLRRIRRIMPVLVVVLVVTTIPAAFLFFADDFELYSRLLLYAFMSAANFYLWNKGNNYFAPDTDLMPLMHIWSLSVEEQFYFIWPVMLVTMATLIKRSRLLLVFIVAFIALLWLSIWMAAHEPLAAYFLLPARAFELLMGAMLALHWKSIPKLPRYANHILSLGGFALIVGASLLLTRASPFPGMNAFWPCLGATLLIVSGKHIETAGIVNRALCWKPVVFIGLISYSLYLWHWPAFVYVTYSGLELEGMLRLIIIASVFVLAYLSWKFVEVPFHYHYKWSFKQSLQRIMLPSFIVIFTLYALIDGYNGFPDRFAALPEFNKNLNYPSFVRAPCFDKHRIGNVDECWLGVKKDRLDGVLVGDSFGNHTAAFLDVLAKDAGLYIHDSTAGAYPLIPRKLEDGSYDKDPEYGFKRLEYAKQFDTIFVGANWDIYASPKNINYEPILQTIGELIDSGMNVVIFSNLRATTKMNMHQYKLFKTRDEVYFDNRDFTIPYAPRPDDFIVTEMQRRYPSIIVIDPNPLMCDEKKCQIEIDGSLIYRSNDHINTSGGRKLGEKYLQQFDNPLRRLNKQSSH